MAATCPKCNAAREVGATDCPQCGVIYAKVAAAAAEERQRKMDQAKDKAQAVVQEMGQKEDPERENNQNLTSCPACHKMVSKNATGCPHCGEPFGQPAPQQIAFAKDRPEAKAPFGCAISGLVIVAFAIFIFIVLPSKFKAEEEKSKKTSSPAEEAQREVEKCFGGWDGAHVRLKEVVKASMNDPESFMVGETRYFDKIDHLIVIMDFRGKNAFGGIVKNSITAKTDKHNCEVLEIIEAPH